MVDAAPSTEAAVVATAGSQLARYHSVMIVVPALPTGLERGYSVFAVIAVAAVPTVGAHTVLAVVAAAGSGSSPSLLSV